MAPASQCEDEKNANELLENKVKFWPKKYIFCNIKYLGLLQLMSICYDKVS